MLDITANIFLLLGAFFVLTAAIGVYRLGDFFSRSHAVGIGDTIGLLCMLIGIVLKLGFTLLSLKIILVILISAITGSTACHALTKAAVHSGDMKDKYRRK